MFILALTGFGATNLNRRVVHADLVPLRDSIDRSIADLTEATGVTG